MFNALRKVSNNSTAGDLGVIRNGIALWLAYCIAVPQEPQAYDDLRFDE